MPDTTMAETLTVDIGADLSGLADQLAQAGRDVNGFATGTVGGANKAMSEAFNGTFGGLGRAITAAARTGTLTMRGMVNDIISDIDRLSIRSSIVQPFEDLVGSALKSVFGSLPGRAAGGPVSAGAPYVVGEQGPELFVPNAAGAIVPGAARGGPQIVFNVQATDAKSFMKSESQVAALLTRALARGQRNL